MLDALNKFADDTKGLKEIKDMKDREQLQKALDNLVRWAKDWGMKYNVDKCKIMHIGRNNPGHCYSMEGRELVKIEEEKDVGVIVHKGLKPSQQCNKAANTARGVLNSLIRNFHYRDRFIFLKLYKQYVRPHLEFACPAWSPWLISDREKLEKIQEKAVRMISGLKSRNYMERCHELGLETLESRRVTQDLVHAYKIIVGDLESNIFELVGQNKHRATRFAEDDRNIVKKRAVTEVRRNFFTNRVADTWNTLDRTIKTAPSLAAFKRAVKTTKREGGRPAREHAMAHERDGQPRAV